MSRAVTMVVPDNFESGLYTAIQIVDQLRIQIAKSGVTLTQDLVFSKVRERLMTQLNYLHGVDGFEHAEFKNGN